MAKWLNVTAADVEGPHAERLINPRYIVMIAPVKDREDRCSITLCHPDGYIEKLEVVGSYDEVTAWLR